MAGKADSSHTHDDRYYTESEIDSKLGGKADSSHTHDDRYYTESEIDNKLANCVTIFGSSSAAMANIFGFNCIYSASQCIGFQPGASGTADANNYAVHLKVADSLWGWMPTKNGYVNLGTPNHRWELPYFTTSPNVSSDRRLKKDVAPISDQYLQFFALLRPVTYRFIDGQSGRIHVGFISQDVEAAMEQAGLTDLDFAGFCKDVKTREVIVKRQRQKQDAEGNLLVDDNGNPLIEECEDIAYEDELDADGNPVYIYSLRYEEFIALDTAVIQRQQGRIEDLEKRIAKLEQLVGDLIAR